MLQTFQTLTKPFLYTSLIVVLASLLSSFELVTTLWGGIPLYVQLIIASLLALVVFPVFAFLVFAWLYVIYYFIFDVLLAGQKIIKLPRSGSKNVSSDTLSQSIKQQYSAQPATGKLESIALTQDDKQFEAFDLGFNFQSRQVRFIGLRGSYLIRFQIDQPTLPTLIVNSHLNNDTDGSIDVGQLSVKSADLGSDFGKSFSLAFIDDSQVDALQIVDPTLMLALLGDYTAYDIVVTQNYVDFKFANINSLKEVDRILTSTSHLVDIITKGADKKTSTAIDVVVSIKKSCTTIKSVQDKLMEQMMTNFVWFIVIMFVTAGIDTILPKWWALVVPEVIALYFILRILLAIAVMSYTFFINAVTTNIIKAFISQSARRARKNYRHIRAAYAS